jgi:hypothetical protein
MSIRFETADVLARMDPLRTDFIVSSSFTHHLGDADLVRFIRWMDRYAAHGWFINDLQRHILTLFLHKICHTVSAREPHGAARWARFGRSSLCSR